MAGCGRARLPFQAKPRVDASQGADHAGARQVFLLQRALRPHHLRAPPAAGAAHLYDEHHHPHVRHHSHFVPLILHDPSVGRPRRSRDRRLFAWRCVAMRARRTKRPASDAADGPCGHASHPENTRGDGHEMARAARAARVARFSCVRGTAGGRPASCQLPSVDNQDHAPGPPVAPFPASVSVCARARHSCVKDVR